MTWLGHRLHDPHRQADVVHDLPSLLRTTVLLAAQGWRDHDDADALRLDPVMRLASSSSAGLTPLVVEQGLASQPTLSRFTAILADEKSLEIRAAEFTTSDIGDAPMLPEHLDQIPPEQAIATVTADGAFDTRKCPDAIAARGAAAINPPRRNAKPWKSDTAGAVARNEILRTSKRVGRTIWRRWSGYQRRSRAETKMHCVRSASA